MEGPVVGMTAGRAAIRLRPSISSETATIRLIQVAGLVAFLIAWQVGGSTAPYLWSTPIRVAGDLYTLVFEDNLLGLIVQSLWTLLVGFALSMVIGVTIGMLMGRYRLFAVMFEPYFAAFYSVPRIAFVPLLVIWFGIGREMVIATVVTATTVLLVFSTAAGVREAGLAFSEVARSIGLTGRQMFTKVLLPGSIPYIATGMKLAVQRALVAVIVAEFVVGLTGIGKLLRDARVTLATDRLFASAFAVMVLGIVLITLTSSIERRLERWRPQVF
jgi:NitT/TauT family transport system permease protein